MTRTMTRIIFFGVVAAGLILGAALKHIPVTILIALGIALVYLKIQAWREKKKAGEENG